MRIGWLRKRERDNFKVETGTKREGKDGRERADTNQNNATRGGSEWMKKSPANINCYAPAPLKHPRKSM